MTRKKNLSGWLFAALSLTLMLAISVQGYAESEPLDSGSEAFDLEQKTVTVYSPGEDGDVAETAYYFSENGLLESITAGRDGQTQTTEAVYTFDDHGCPESFSFDTGEGIVTAQIENVYDADLLVHARITGIQVDGDELLDAQDSDHGAVSASQNAFLVTPVTALESFILYRDADLTVAGWDEIRRRYEGGRMVESSTVFPGMCQVQTWIYSEDGTVEASLRSDQWQGGAWVTRSEQVSVRDEKNMLTQLRFISEDQTAVRMLRYEEETDPATGARMLVGYQEGQDDPEYQGSPLVRYTLDENGLVTTCEEVTAGVTSRYDSQGRTVFQRVAPGGEVRAEYAWQYRS